MKIFIYWISTIYQMFIFTDSFVCLHFCIFFPTAQWGWQCQSPNGWKLPHHFLITILAVDWFDTTIYIWLLTLLYIHYSNNGHLSNHGHDMHLFVTDVYIRYVSRLTIPRVAFVIYSNSQSRKNINKTRKFVDFYYISLA